MNLLLAPIPRIAPLILLLAGAGVSAADEKGRHSVSEIAELLVSDRPDDAAKGKSELAAQRAELIGGLLKTLEAGVPSDMDRLEAYSQASAQLGVILSPWVRGRECSARSQGSMSFETPRRPVERVAGLPEAPAVRKALQATIPLIKEEMERRKERDYQLDKTIAWQCEALAEVADDATIDWALTVLAGKPDPYIAEPLAKLVDSYLGRPRGYQISVLCGTGLTEEDLKRYRDEEQTQIAKASDELAATWKEVRAMKPGGRIAFSIRQWRQHFVPRQEVSSGSYHLYQKFIFEEFAPLIRFGTPALGQLRAQQAQETRLEVKGVWEVVIAAITGEANPELVRALLETEAPYRSDYRSLVSEIIIAAGSKKWLAELEALQYSTDHGDLKPARAIAICNREEGIPALRRILEKNPDNYYAEYALKEMEERAAKGFPKHMMRR